MNVKETAELIDYARSKKLFFMEAIWSRFFPAYLKLKEEIDSGSIGEVLQVVAGMGLQFPEENWRRYVELLNLNQPKIEESFSFVCLIKVNLRRTDESL